MHPSVVPPPFKAGGRSSYKAYTQTQLCQFKASCRLLPAFCPTHLLFIPHDPALPSRTYGDHLEVWRGRCLGVLSLQNVAAKGAWLAWTTCSPGSLWRGMFNSLIPHPSLLLLLLFLHNLKLNLGFTLGNENYFEGFRIMRMRA